MILSKADIAWRRSILYEYAQEMRVLDSHEELRAQRDRAVVLLRRLAWVPSAAADIMEFLAGAESET